MHPIKEGNNISVWLDNSKNHVLKDFHCSECGCLVFQYYSSASIIIPGKESEGPFIVIMCRGKDKFTNERCRAKYYIS
jgi:hypothetical protein